MVRIVSFCLWLGACAFSPLAGAQANSAQSGAKAATHVTCALACTAAQPSTCAPLGIQSGMPTSPMLPAPATGAQCQGLQLPAYTSAWANYQPWRDDAVGDWRQANSEVARIGGWRVYARETAPIANTTAPAKDVP
jgi:hypothetical protein